MTPEIDPTGGELMTAIAAGGDTLTALDAETATLVRLAGLLAGGTDEQVHDALQEGHQMVRPVWVEEVLLQTYLFAGFPRALNGMRAWREISGIPAPVQDVDTMPADGWRARGEATCARVYGPTYDRLRQQVQALHPDLDTWMVQEGYGKVLGRSALDLPRRELCVVAACAMSGQDRQLRAHLYGALHAGVPLGVVTDTLDMLAPLVGPDAVARHASIWQRVQDASSRFSSLSG